jgi:hypothetical protein
LCTGVAEHLACKLVDEQGMAGGLADDLLHTRSTHLIGGRE